ncbi:MAG: hypothetical protein M1820_007900 [Bogoriella megaspora]|nr:MAG: hypothetical protein M1820_007900 [Bogoriella megaspora]
MATRSEDHARMPSRAPNQSHSVVPRKRTAMEAAEEAYVAGEDHFVLRQAKRKAEIRVREDNGKRARPIDWLMVSLRTIEPKRNPVDDDMVDDELDLVDSESVLEGLPDSEVNGLNKDIDMFLNLEYDKTNLEYWRTMKLILNERHDAKVKDRSYGLDESISGEMDTMLKKKTYDGLKLLEGQVQKKLAALDGEDRDYWNQLLRKLHLWKAKAHYTGILQSLMVSRMGAKREEAAKLAWEAQKSLMEILSGRPTSATQELSAYSLLQTQAHPFDPEPLLKIRSEDKHIKFDDEDTYLQDVKLDRQKVRKYGPQTKGLKVYSKFDANPVRDPISVIEDISRAGTGSAEMPKDSSTTKIISAQISTSSRVADEMYAREKARGFDENEQFFNAEEDITPSILPSWANQYPPRVPRYFNRVRYGFEWNKYNQTHYDNENPPPKAVQGYRFNIFYPDLIDKSKTPTYRIERKGKSAPANVPQDDRTSPHDYCTIRFIAGPPYMDLAFTIVDRPWDFSARKNDYRSNFDKAKSLANLMALQHPKQLHVNREHRNLPACEDMIKIRTEDAHRKGSALKEEMVSAPWLNHGVTFQTSDGYGGTENSPFTINTSNYDDGDFPESRYSLAEFRSVGIYQPAASQMLMGDLDFASFPESQHQLSNYELDNHPESGLLSCPRILPDMPPSHAYPLHDLPQSRQQDLGMAYPPQSYEIDPQGSSGFTMSRMPENGQNLQLLDREISLVEQDSPTRSRSQTPMSQLQYAIADSRGISIPSPRDDVGLVPSRDMTPDGDMKEEPYAKRIHRCLLSAPNHTRVLREIYDWFIENTEKGQEPEASAWKNSIRHNLSMNAAFVKVTQPQGDERAKGCLWKLADFAVKDGVKSTTRYRTKTTQKRNVNKTKEPSAVRVDAGSKGGLASKKAAHERRIQKALERNPYPQTSTHLIRPSPNPHLSPWIEPPICFNDRSMERSMSPYFVPQTEAGACYNQLQPAPFHYDQTIIAQPRAYPPTSAPPLYSRQDLHSPPESPAMLGSVSSRLTHYHGVGQALPSPDEPFFCDSPNASSDEPQTPSTNGQVWCMDPFLGSQTAGDDYAVMDNGYPA